MSGCISDDVAWDHLTLHAPDGSAQSWTLQRVSPSTGHLPQGKVHAGAARR